MKLKYTLVFSIISFFITTAGFAQALSDQEIGFDVARTTIMLKENGVKDQDLGREIMMMREMQLQQYVEMKKIKDGILQKSITEQTSKANTGLISNTARTTVVDISQTEKDALIALYNSTNGASWYNRSGWDAMVANPTAVVSYLQGTNITDGHIIQLSLDNNNLDGVIPVEIGNLKNLITLVIHNNPKLTGSIPSEIGDLSSLKVLSIYKNGFNGLILSDVGNLINLEDLTISLNSSLSGEIPKGIGKLLKLTKIWMFSNGLTGSIPPEIGNLSNLIDLNLYYNKLSGPIPKEIGNLASLKYLDLAANYNLSGPIPSEIGKLSALTNLSLYSNLFTEIPSEIGNLKNLSNLNLFNNKIKNIPIEIGQLNNLKYLDISSNQLIGLLPSSVGNLSNLEHLNLGDNKLEGSLPISLQSLTKLTYFRINTNKFSNYLPDLTASINLRDVSFYMNKFRFLDFADQFSIYKTRFTKSFYYSSQAKTDTEITVNGVIGGSVTLTMCEDNRFAPNDTFQWYKNGSLIPGAITRQYVISNLSANNVGDYYCLSKNPQITPEPQNLILTRETIHLKVTNCPPVAGTLNPSVANPTVNASTTFSLQTATTGLTYKWTFYNDANGTVVKDGTQTTATASQSYSIAGSYLVRLEVTEANGCITKFDKVVNVINNCISGTIETPKPATTVDGITVSFNTTATGLKYAWRFYYLDGTTGGEVFTTQTANRKFDQPGNYRVTLEVTDASGCKTNFETMVTVTHTCVTGNGHLRILDSKSDTEVVVGFPANFDLVDGPWYTSQEWKFYNPDGTLKEEQNSTGVNGISQTFTTPGTYKVTLKINDSYGCPTIYEKEITVLGSCTIPVEERLIRYTVYEGNNQMYPSRDQNVLVNSVSTFSFIDYYYRSADVIYKWSLFDPNGSLIGSSTEPIFTTTPTALGNYKIELRIMDKIGCSTILNYTIKVVDECIFYSDRLSGAINVTDDYGKTSFVKINETKELYFRSYNEDPARSFSYKWKLYDPKLVLIGEGNQNTFPITLTSGGFYKVVMVITDGDSNCTAEHTKIIGCLIGNSCTELNPKSAMVKDLYFNLLKNLISRSILGETDEQINSSAAPLELIALKPYITNGIADRIYNFVTSRDEDGQITKIDFAFAPNREYDVHISVPNGINFDSEMDTEQLMSAIEQNIYFNLDQFIAPDDYLVSCYYQQATRQANPNRVILQPEDCDLESEVRYIDFCPKDCLAIEGSIKYTPQVLNANVVANFSLETAATNLTYDWTFYNVDNSTVLAKASTAVATQSFIAAGRYRVVLTVKDEKGCETSLETYTTVLPACTPITGVIKIGSGNASGNSVSTLFQFSSPGSSTFSLACNETSFPLKLYTIDKQLQVGTRLFLDANLILRAGTGNVWYKNDVNGISYRVDANGVIAEIFNCSSSDPSASLGYEYIISPGAGFNQHYVRFIAMDGFESSISLSRNDGTATICAKSIIEDNGEGTTSQTGNRCN